MMTCKKTHKDIAHILDTIDVDQGGQGRHKCAGCAYDQGYKHGKKNLPPHLDIDTIDYSQAKSHRHKSPNIAYATGYVEGYHHRKRK